MTLQTTLHLQTMSQNNYNSSSSSFAFHPNDVLLGRGGSTNKHSGNQRYRTIVADHQPEYLLAKKKDKVLIARRIVALVQASGGQFLKFHNSTGNWQPVPDKRAQEKTSQALREGLDVRARMGTKTRPPQTIHKNTTNTPSSSSSATASASTRKRSKASLARARLAQRSPPGTSIPTSPIVSPTMVSLPEQSYDHNNSPPHDALWMPHLSLSYDNNDTNDENTTTHSPHHHHDSHHLATMPPRPLPFLQYAERQFSRSDVKDECAV